MRVKLYFVKLGGSAFTYKHDVEKIRRFQEILTSIISEIWDDGKNGQKESGAALFLESISELTLQVQEMIKKDVVLSFANELARWRRIALESSENQEVMFIIILGGGSPAHAAVKVARASGLDNLRYGVLIRQVVGMMSSFVVSILATRLNVNHVPPSSWFFWEEESDGQVTLIRSSSSPPPTLNDHLRAGIIPVLGGDVILGRNGWSIISGDPIPYFLYHHWFNRPSITEMSRYQVVETVMLSDIGVDGRVAGFYDKNPLERTAHLVTEIKLLTDNICEFQLEDGKTFMVPLSSIGDDQSNEHESSSVDVTGGMLQKIWWQLRLAREGVPTRIIDVRLFRKYIDGEDVPQTFIHSSL